MVADWAVLLGSLHAIGSFRPSEPTKAFPAPHAFPLPQSGGRLPCSFSQCRGRLSLFELSFSLGVAEVARREVCAFIPLSRPRRLWDLQLRS